MSYTEINGDAPDPLQELSLWVCMLFIVAVLFVVMSSALFPAHAATASNYYSEYPDVMLHTSIRPKHVAVKKEPTVEVQRYEAPNWQGDPEVLVSLPKAPRSTADVIVVDHSKIMAERINQLQKRINELEKMCLENKAHEVTGSMVDDGKVEDTWTR